MLHSSYDDPREYSYVSYPYHGDDHTRRYDSCRTAYGCDDRECRRGCDILTPLASGSLRTRGDWVCIDLPRHIAGTRPIRLTTIAADGVSSAIADPTCDPCRSPYGMSLRVTVPVTMTTVDCYGCQHTICSSIEVCVPITQAACEHIPRNAKVRVKACVSLAEPLCIDECERFVEALLDIRIDAYIVGMPPKPYCEPDCPSSLPWYPQPARLNSCGHCYYDHHGHHDHHDCHDRYDYPDYYNDYGNDYHNDYY